MLKVIQILGGGGEHLQIDVVGIYSVPLKQYTK